MDKDYLGDGVYAEHDGRGMLTVTTEDGISVKDRIFVEPEVLAALIGYARRHMHAHTFSAVLAQAGVR